MATKLVTAYITLNGTPTLGLSPTIKIWEYDISSHTVIIVADPMVEIGDGLYKYGMVNYDPRKNYAFVVDSDPTFGDIDRYQVSINESYVEDIAFETWEEVDTDHDNLNTMGARVNDITDALLIVEEILKYHKNRTLIDENFYTLTVFDDDGVTPLKVFDLKDENGVATISRIFERLPQ